MTPELHIKKGIFLLAAIIVLIAGALVTYYTYSATNARERNSMLTYAKTSAAALDTEEIKNLSGTKSDINSLDYQKLKEILSKIKNVNSDVRFVYLMGYRGGEKVYFFMDSEPSNSPDISLPGDIYEDTTPGELQGFKDGEPFIEGPVPDQWGNWVSAFSPVFDQSGNILALLGMDIDASLFESRIQNATLIPLLITLIALAAIFITYVRLKNIEKFERTILEDKERLKTIIEEFPYGILIQDENQNTLIQNEELTNVFGGTANIFEFKNPHSQEFIKRMRLLFKDFHRYLDRIDEIIREKKIVIHEKIELANGRFVTRSYVPFYFKEKFRGSIWIFKDVTEEERIDEMKTEFVSLASHQLKTPISTIREATELLLTKYGDQIKGEEKEFLDQILISTLKMNDLVNDLLDVSKLEMGTFEIKIEEGDLVKIAEEALKEQQASFDDKKQKVKVGFDKKLPKIPLDKKIASIVIQNLLSNANKYTQKGGKISLVIRKEEDNIIISVTDNGLGIPRSQQSSIFKKLFRGQNVKTLNVEGTGLGLYTIKTMVEAAGCQITFESEENKGTTFRFIIPITGMVKIIDKKLF